MKAAPYTRETIQRIRDGARASDLGWDNQFYATVCRRHELTPVLAAAPIDTIAPLKPAPAPIPAGGFSFDPSTRELRRGECAAVVLTRRQAEMLLVLVDQPPGKPLMGADYAERIGIGASNISSYVNGLRTALDPAGLYVLGVMGRGTGGYMLIDQRSREPATISVLA